MEFLVNMTTLVPAGTPEKSVDDVRAREAAHSRQLAAEHHLLRLWRPPLQPGEWRSLGLFAADDATRLEAILAAMPLRVWRTDEVTSLSPHPNDPDRRSEAALLHGEPGGEEFLVTFVLTVPSETAPDVGADLEAREAERARMLAADGTLLRLWRLPESGHTLGLWRAVDEPGIHAVLAALPLAPWMRVEVTPLTAHPSDPGVTNG
jgi:muconolactone delta-isomerase